MNEPLPPGFFGKIPARGDFLSRRVPPGFGPAWETWLQDLTVAVRSAGQPGWQDAWLTAPLWHFALGARLAAPHGAAGILLASADRVGRLFPFTVIGAADPASRTAPEEWGRAVEALAMAALDDGYDPAMLDDGLAALGPPPLQTGPDRPSGLWPVVLDGDWPEAGDRLADDAQDAPGPGQSVWWCRGSDRVDPVRLRCNGLPGPHTASAMILGGEDVTVSEPRAYG